MHLNHIFPIIFCCIFIGSELLSAQNRSFLGVLPNIQFQDKLHGKLDYFLQLGSEINALNRTYGGREFPAEVQTSDLTAGITFDPDPNLNLASGFQARLREPFADEPTHELRPWQQITLVTRLEKFRLRNRLRIEQRFVQRERGEPHDFYLRLRYRLSLDFPLAGERLDDKEFYLNTSAEWQLTPTRNDAFYFSNLRGYLGLGFRFNRYHRLEAGPELRTRHLSREGNRENFWFWRMTWVIQR
jgi:hypothetical protein